MFFSKEGNIALSHTRQLSVVQVRNNSECDLTSEAKYFGSDRNLIKIIDKSVEPITIRKLKLSKIQSCLNIDKSKIIIGKKEKWY